MLGDIMGRRLRWSSNVGVLVLIAAACTDGMGGKTVWAASANSFAGDVVEDPAAAAIEEEIFGKVSKVPTQRGNCSHKILIQWTAELEENIFSTPVILDVGGDNIKDIVVSTFRRHTFVLDGVYGEHTGGFPFTLPQSAFYSSPVVYDINGDGEEDLGLTTFNGELIWVDAGGMPIFGKSIKLPHLRVHKEWQEFLAEDADTVLTGKTQFEETRRGPHQGEPRVWAMRQPKANTAKLYHETVWQAANPATEPSPKQPQPSAGGVPIASGGRRLQQTEDELPLDGEELVDGEAYVEDPALPEDKIEYEDIVDKEAGRPASVDMGVSLAALRGAEDDGEDLLLCSPTHSGWGEIMALYQRAIPANEEEDADADGDDVEERVLASILGKDEVLASVMGVATDDLRRLEDRNSSRAIPGERPVEANYAFIDPHVLCSPIIADLDNDHQDEIIFAVSYYYHGLLNATDTTLDGEVPDFNPHDFVASALVVFDIETGELKWETRLDLTTDRAVRQARITSSPTVVDADWDGKLEVVVVTNIGAIYVVDHTGQILKGFPVTMDTIEGQIAMADIDDNGRIEFVASDVRGNVASFNMYGYQNWETHVEGFSVQGPILGDVNGDGLIDVVVATNKGLIYALEGKTGEPLAGFPVDTQQPIAAPPLLLSLPGNGQGSAGWPVQSIIVPSLDGMICYSMILAEDLTGNGRMDLIFTSVTGHVMALSTGMMYDPLKAWPSRSMGNNNLLLRDSYQGVFFLPQHRGQAHSGRTMVLWFEIVDKRRVRKASSYRVRISMGGGQRLWAKDYYLPGPHMIEIKCPQGTMHSVLTVELVNESGQHFEDSISVSFNVYFYRPLKWLIIASFLVMAGGLASISEMKFQLPRFRRYYDYDEEYDMRPPDPFQNVLSRIFFMILFIFVTLMCIFVYELEQLIEARKHRKIE